MTTHPVPPTHPRRRRALALGLALGLSAIGCELAVDFDRSKIDGGSPDASIADAAGDGTVPDANQDTGLADQSAPDADAGATADAGDASTDAADARADGDAASLLDADAAPLVDAADVNVPDTNDAAPCNAVTLGTSPTVVVADSTATLGAFTPAPLPTSGTFYLTSDVYDLPDGGASGKAGTDVRRVLVFGAATADEALQVQAGSIVQSSYAAAATSTALTLTRTCPLPAVATTWQFTVVAPDGGTVGSPGTQLIASPDGVEVLTFTQQ